MKRPKCKDCPKHSLECRKTCEEWIEYEKEYMEEKRFFKKYKENEIFAYNESKREEIYKFEKNHKRMGRKK